jgi:hypothetical protein
MAIIPAVTDGNTSTTAARPMMSPTACATEISPHTNPQDRLSTWSTTTADIGEYAMLIVAWQSVHQMAMSTMECCRPRIAWATPPVTRPMSTVTHRLSLLTHRSE